MFSNPFFLTCLGELFKAAFSKKFLALDLSPYVRRVVQTYVINSNKG